MRCLIIRAPFAGVSIHASSREDATDMIFRNGFKIPFQSTRPRGRTRLPVTAIMVSGNSFNPRVLAGGRDFAPLLQLQFSGVSIHASSREDATIAKSPLLIIEPCFNPRVLAGGRDIASRRFRSSSGFNPRVLAGGRDLLYRLAPCIRQVSIHASSREDATR